MVLAGYNMMIPYLCPELPPVPEGGLAQPGEDSARLHERGTDQLAGVRRTQALRRLRAGELPSYFYLNPHVTIGSYQSTKSPSEPILVHMVRTPCKPGLPEHDQNRAGRAELLATPFETFEYNIRDQLGRALKDGGFDPARDITAITVNRWPHGYAPEYNVLFQPELPEDRLPHVVGRAPFGRITIANSDREEPPIPILRSIRAIERSWNCCTVERGEERLIRERL